MTVEEANKQFPNYTWVLAKLPDGEIDAVSEVEGAEGCYLTAEDGYPYDEDELVFVDETYLNEKLKQILSAYTMEQVRTELDKIEKEIQ